MNSQNLKYAYEILDNIFENDIAFSLGGYQSLIKQNILKEFRPINDIDVNIIIDNAATAGELIQDRIEGYFRNFSTFGIMSGKDDVLKLNTEPERDYYKKKVERDKKDPEVESDVCFSISLTLKRLVDYRSKYQKKKTYTKSDLDNPLAYWPSDPLYLHIEPTISSQSERESDPWQRVEIGRGILDQIASDTTNGWGTPSFYFNGTDPINYYANNVASATYPFSPKMSIPKSQENKDQRVFIPTNVFNDFIKEQMFDKLMDLILSSSNELTIDFFLMEHDPKHTQISTIDEENYTAYYPILKAKHRYCTEKFTPEKSFRKHIQDLSLSFNTKRIKGLNYPEDIELLIKNWEEMHEEDK